MTSDQLRDYNYVRTEQLGISIGALPAQPGDDRIPNLTAALYVEGQWPTRKDMFPNQTDTLYL
jgi:hypothetical protein